MPKLAGWSIIHVKEGSGYHLQAPVNRELETGAVLVTTSATQGSIRASRLGEMSLCAFNVIPARLTGLVTLGEQQFFETAAAGKEPRIFPARHRVGTRMAELNAERNRAGLLFRLKLLEIFAELFRNEPEPSAPREASPDARKRLQDFLEQTPSSELLELNFNELAQMTHCTSRHLSRIFHELVGMSFRDKRAELRLARARELLATTNAKVVDVALESGFKSLSLFNLMFARRFGLSPGKWRKQNARQSLGKKNGVKRAKSFTSPALSVPLFPAHLPPPPVPALDANFTVA